ncbi:hypothetical protein GOB07_19960 [Sinorhizobium meliloti]|nr:hypothetical protein [Sinorhizobium meliloti]MDW9538308.1 hypothetical protein [Sinorhizobium meliloti]MDW9643203.1 hypothetical protein [Sinorhizobium meliloti]
MVGFNGAKMSGYGAKGGLAHLATNLYTKSATFNARSHDFRSSRPGGTQDFRSGYDDLHRPLASLARPGGIPSGTGVVGRARPDSRSIRLDRIIDLDDMQ